MVQTARGLFTIRPWAVLLGAAVVIAASGNTAKAQLSLGGTPPSLSANVKTSIETMTMPAVDAQALLDEDARDAGKDIPLRFGYPHYVDFTLENSGTWDELPNGDRIWRLGIECPDAYSINLIYKEFHMPDGARLYIYNAQRSQTLGAFSSQNNKEHGEFATAPVAGDHIILEYYEPALVRNQGAISISSVVHAYRNIFGFKEDKGFGDAGSCNNNTICPEGDDWRDQIASVAMITTSGGSRLCTGFMVNNVRQDKTPYFMTANHCLGSSNTWVFIFNYESPTCTPNQDGPTNMSVSGSSLLANNSDSDFGLLLLNEAPPDSYEVFFSGWSAVDMEGDSAVGIHHPSGDVKKISFDYDVYPTSDYDPSPYLANSHWEITSWDDGTTEPGSSGSPLYDKEHRAIGQLHGGWASCTDTRGDFYGKIAMSWDRGSTPSTRLKDWLDPDDTGTLEIDGIGAAGVFISHDPLPDTKDDVNPYEVVATIVSDTLLDTDSLFLRYTISSVETEVLLTATANPDEYHGYIPAQSAGTIIDYYLEAHNERGDADTTDVFTFRVIDFDPQISPAFSSKSGAALDSAWHDFTITNNGIFSDEILLSLTGFTWTTKIFESTGTTEISTTGVLAPDATFDIKVLVEIPSSMFGDTDSGMVKASSVGDPSVAGLADVQTISAGEPLSIPFYDPVPTSTIDIGLWVQVSGAQANDIGLGEPSAPYSLNFNGDPNGADTVMSQAIDLDGLSGLALAYAYEQTGGGESADAGDDLFVEYYSQFGVWELLNQHLGDGPDMTSYVVETIALPLNAYHSAFRLRIRNTATAGAFDDWFVDDVRVDYPAEAAVTPASVDEELLRPDSDYVELFVTNVGQGTLDYSVSLRPKFGPSKYAEAPARVAYPEDWRGMELAKEEYDPRRGVSQEKGSGGPDGFGHVWVDSDEPGGPTFTFEDIKTTGTLVTGLTDDNSQGPFAIGFSFPYYGNLETEYYIGSNGVISLGSSGGLGTYTNVPIPTAAAPNNALMWLWDDLNPTEPNHLSEVYIDADTARCIIQFNDYAEYDISDAGGSVTAQVVLFPDGTIEYRYLTFAGGMILNESTIGLENNDGTDGLEVVFNASYLHDDLLVRFIAPTQWLSVSPLSGSLLMGESATLTAWMHSADLDTGYFYYDIEVNSNDPDPGDNPWVVPLSLHVTDCDCPAQGDWDGTGTLTIVDVIASIDYVFRSGAPPIQDPGCPQNRGNVDADANGDVTIIDVIYMIDVALRSGPCPVDPCTQTVPATCP